MKLSEAEYIEIRLRVHSNIGNVGDKIRFLKSHWGTWVGPTVNGKTIIIEPELIMDKTFCSYKILY